MKTGLVLEGGGMRGLYTAGVLDWLLDKQLAFPYCIGVSAGACNAVSYISRQRGRNYRINTDYIRDKRYLSVWNFLKNKSMFGMDFIFDEIPHHLDPFDYEQFLENPCVFYAGVTDATTGKAVYFGKEDMQGHSTVLRASSAIPVFSQPVSYKGGIYLDGGTSDPIPFRRALEDGCDRLVIVLTRPRGYRKKPESMRRIYHHMLRHYPKMIDTMDHRHEVYNVSLDEVFALETQGKAVVFAPPSEIKIDRFEKDIAVLKALYNAGYNDAKEREEKLAAFI